MKIRRALTVAGLVAGVGCLFAIAVLCRVGGPRSGTAAYLSIVHTLQQIDAAKQMYTAEHGSSADTLVSREQLQQYLPADSWQQGAKYHIGRMRDSPEATLTRQFDQFPAKTIIRLVTNSVGIEIVPPS